jgi:predicted DNA-binding transcriptional regulator AlpA
MEVTVTELMTQHELASLLDIGTATLANWRSAGKGPRYVKLGGKVKYRKIDVDAFINGSVRASTCDTTVAH